MTYSVRYEDFGLRDYKETWDYQEEIFQKLVDRKKVIAAEGPVGNEPDCGCLIFVEHPHVYTLGKSGSESNLLINYIQLQAKDAKFYKIDRGGDITYHGPGQLVGYPIFDLERIGVSLKNYIRGLEEAVIMTLGEFGVMGGRLDGATGVWLEPSGSEVTRKICAIGVRASKYITMHGFAFNVNTDLDYFNFINPCGYTDKGVTSLEKELGQKQDMGRIKESMRKSLKEVFKFEWTNS